MSAEDPSPFTVEPSGFTVVHWRKPALIVALLFSGAALFVFAAGRMWQSLNGPPFRMVIEPVDEAATVQFVQAERGLLSKAFLIDQYFQNREEVVLNSPTVTISVGKIEFADTTLRRAKCHPLPGGGLTPSCGFGKIHEHMDS